jgi:AraC-like DNA-binding protein
MQPTTHPKAAQALRLSLDTIGLPGEDILARTDEQSLRRGGVPRISRAALQDAKAHAAQLANDHSLGLLLGASSDLTHLDILGAAIQHAHSVQDAIEVGARFISFWEEGSHVRVQPHQQTLRIIYENDVSARSLGNALDCQHSTLLIANAAHQLLRHTQLPIVVGCACDASAATVTALQALPYEVRLETSQWFIEMPLEALAIQLPKLHPAADALIQQALRQTYAALSPDIDTLTALRTVLDAALPHSPTIAHAARDLAMSTRKLQGLLQAQDTTFSEALARARLDRALQLLPDHSLPIKGVAAALGFQSSAAFSRFFQRRTGRSPQAHRALSAHAKIER